MSDDRRFERDARAWLEIGPTDAPDRVVQAALIEIDTTSQERDFGVPWRLPIMSMTSRLAAAAIVVVVAVGVAFVFFRPGASDVGSPSPSPQVTAAPTPSEASSVTVAAFKSARDAICTTGTAQRDQLKPRMIRVYAETATEAERADGIAAIDEFIVMDGPLLDELAALEAPPSLHDGHVANVQQFRDQLTLVREISRRLHAGDFAGAQPIDETTDILVGEIQGWEQSYNFLACP